MENTSIIGGLRYVVDPFKLKALKAYGKIWIPLVEKFDRKHHEYFMSHEGLIILIRQSTEEACDGASTD